MCLFSVLPDCLIVQRQSGHIIDVQIFSSADLHGTLFIIKCYHYSKVMCWICRKVDSFSVIFFQRTLNENNLKADKRKRHRMLVYAL